MKRTPGTDEDLALLKSDPAHLLLKHRETVKLIVRIYVASGMFPVSEFDDVLQSVFEELFRRIPAMQRQFRGNALFVTYLSSIVRNICRTMQKAAIRRIKTTDTRDAGAEDPESLHDTEVVDRIFRQFKTILTLYDTRLPRILFVLKLRYRIPLTGDEIAEWYPQSDPPERETLLRSFGHHYEKMKEQQIYRIVAPILNRLENRTTKPDTWRRFTASIVKEIVGLLNGHPPRHTFDEDSLGVLVEKYFFRN